MMVSLDAKQAEVLREILEAQLKELEIESARTDAYEFRELLHKRTHIVEALLKQLPS